MFLQYSPSLGHLMLWNEVERTYIIQNVVKTFDKRLTIINSFKLQNGIIPVEKEREASAFVLAQQERGNVVVSSGYIFMPTNSNSVNQNDL